MELELKKSGSDLVITVPDARLDAAIAVRFKDAVRRHIEGPHDRIVLDLSAVEFLDSSGLGAVVSIFKEVGSRKTFCLAGLNPHVDKVLRLTRMDSVFSIYPDVDSALGGIPHAS